MIGIFLTRLSDSGIIDLPIDSMDDQIGLTYDTGQTVTVQRDRTEFVVELPAEPESVLRTDPVYSDDEEPQFLGWNVTYREPVEVAEVAGGYGILNNVPSDMPPNTCLARVDAPENVLDELHTALFALDPLLGRYA